MKQKIIKGRYKVTSRIDEDHLFYYLRVNDLEQKTVKPLMLKILKNKHLKDNNLVRRLTYEAQEMLRLNHELFAKVYEIDFIDNVYFQIIEFIDGSTLKALLDKNQTFSLSLTLNIMTQLAKAIGYAYKAEVKNRNLKLEDIYLTPDGRIKILSFHSPRALDTDPDDTRMSGIGPDIYFLGITFWQLITSSKLADTMELVGINEESQVTLKGREFEPEVTQNLRRIIYRSITKKISERFSTIDEFLEEIRNFVQNRVKQYSDDQVNLFDESAEIKPESIKTKPEPKNTDNSENSESKNAYQSLSSFPANSRLNNQRSRPKKPLWMVTIWTISIVIMGISVIFYLFFFL